MHALTPSPERRPLLLVCSDRAEIAARVILLAEREGFDARSIEREELTGFKGPEALLLLDMRLGGTIGAGTLAALRCEPRWGELPVIALVGDRDDAAIRDALGAGADDFVRDTFLDRDLPWRLIVQRRAWEARDELRQRENDQGSLLSLTRAFAGALDAGALIEEVTRTLAAELSLRRCSLVLTDPRAERGTVLATSDEPGPVRMRLELSRYPEIREVLRTRKPLIIEHAERHPLLDPVKDAITAAGIGTMLVLPLSLEEEVLGVLFLRSASETLKGREVDFATTVANATAMALRNVRSVDEIRQRVEHAESKLEDLRQFEEIYEHVADGIVLVDSRNGRLLSLNPAALAILGADPRAARGKRIEQVLDGVAGARCLALLEKVAAGEVVHGLEIEARRSDGRELHLEVSGAHLRDEVVLLSARDVTERKRFQAMVAERQEEAARQAMIVELAGAAAHELNQPLTAVMGYAELLNRRVPESDPSAQQVAIIYREAERMAAIVKKIARIIRYETTAYVGDARIVDIDGSSSSPANDE